ncbi:sugar ABC transporter ATP-binding protein [Solicola gregarius]|uniref:Sugar ABC transporter ATP-binding protein n=1 Tax=Solicola gregarius TaxID=2908642 RepID=A0AA46YM89_9ACTN|nr:sugar ABC transporter ATP-binding protein [Solicola gregarius]UYM07467.1 sugar ABC transporter ATP-binding protein [Solicola gregarius]
MSTERDENPAPVPLLEMRGIVKQFPGVRALDGVDLTVRAGEVHCLLGQNGAGKSTLIKVLAGAYDIDEGEIRWDGETKQIGSPQEALDLGVATIYQELDLIDGLSVAENIYLGHELATGGFTRRGAAAEATRDLMRRLGHPEIRPGREVGALPSAGKQIVSMARALSHDAKVIVMDEPTAALDSDEVDGLFRVIADLRAEGAAIVYISHRLEEIRRIGDRITVLKDGRTVGTDLPASTETTTLINLMTGRSIEYVFPAKLGDVSGAEPVVQVENLSRKGEFSDVSFDVRPGEIVGLAGLVGAGRSEILETIFGARKADSGTVTIGGRRLRRGSVAAAVAAGMGLCPEERKYQGLVLDDAIYRNITMPTFGRFARFGFTNATAERRAASDAAGSVDLRPTDTSRVTRTLSGGNQQKVVLARWLLRDCRVLMLDEPTRGVDVGARSEIYALIRQLAEEGVAVLVVSSEIEEVLGLADRVLVISNGRIVHQGASEDIDEHGVLDLVMEGRVA